MIAGNDLGRVAGPAQRDAALAVLYRFLRVHRLQHAFGLRHRAEERLNQRERLRLVELAGHEQDRVVRLVEPVIERLQPVNRDVLDVRPCADRAVAVVVPQVRGGQHTLLEDARRIVFAALELVADDGHLAVEVLFRDERVDHAVGFQLQRPLQIGVGRLDRLEIVRAIEPRRRVRARAVFGELLRDVRVALRPLELQVLEQVRHAGLPVPLVGRADQIRDVDGDRRLALIRKEQHAEAVGEAVFGDAFDRRHALLRACRRRQQQDQCRTKNQVAHGP